MIMAVVCIFTTTSVFAQATKNTPSKQISNLTAAADFADYGYQNKSSLALITAASILNATPANEKKVAGEENAEFSAKQLLEDAKKFLLDELIELESEIPSINWKKLKRFDDSFEFNDFTILNTDNLFFKNIQIVFRFIKISKKIEISEEEFLKNNYGDFDDSYMKLENNKAVKGIIRLNIAYYEGNFKNDITKNLITHELEHYYEHYKRALNNGDKSFSYMSNVTNIAKEKNLNNEKNEFLNNLSFLMYCSLYFERNANLSTLYGELMNMPGNSLKEIKNDFIISKIYKSYYKYLENPQQIFNKELYLNNQIDLNIINKYINDSMENI